MGRNRDVTFPKFRTLAKMVHWCHNEHMQSPTVTTTLGVDTSRRLGDSLEPVALLGAVMRGIRHRLDETVLRGFFARSY